MVDEKWVLVPREPTQEMIDRGRLARMNIEGGYGGPSPWEAMIAAAPPAPASPDRGQAVTVEEIARVIAHADEQNGSGSYDQRIAMGKHVREQLFDEARAVLALLQSKAGRKDNEP